MIAAENGALPGGKVGGLGDVIRELPPALARAGQQVSIITPGYGVLASEDNASLVASVEINFAGRQESLSLFAVTPPQPHPQVSHWVLEHWLFSSNGVGHIYSSDFYGPFATDAYKFALFCIAVCEVVKQHLINDIDVLHCHDWHTSLVLLLREFSKHYIQLQHMATAFSIHNLSIQGARPFSGDDSSLEGWLRDLLYERDLIADPHNPDCINFMRAGINLADIVNTVSPTYAEEILQPSNPEQGFIGGDGLENDLQQLHDKGRLVGILNGVSYPDSNDPDTAESAVSKHALWQLVDQCLDQWAGRPDNHSTSYYFALRNLQHLARKRNPLSPVLVSIGRLTDQKLSLLLQPCGRHSALDKLLNQLKAGALILLGSGDDKYDRFFTAAMARYKNFLFLNGYSEELSNALYQFGDLFLMPSSYEPCGISQLLAMRAGMPCLVHATGGLKDTVSDGETGFVFDGATIAEQVENMLMTAARAVDYIKNQPQQWQTMCERATATRFTWDKSAQLYLTQVYPTQLKTVNVRKLVN